MQIKHVQIPPDERSCLWTEHQYVNILNIQFILYSKAITNPFPFKAVSLIKNSSCLEYFNTLGKYNPNICTRFPSTEV